MNPKSNPIKVAVSGAQGRTYRTLQMFFQDQDNTGFELTVEDQADISILDLDGDKDHLLLQTYRAKYPDRPTIVLSDSYKNISGTFFVRKPFHIASLARALSQASVFITAARNQDRPRLIVVNGNQTTAPPQAETFVQSGVKHALDSAQKFVANSKDKTTELTKFANGAATSKLLYYADKSLKNPSYVKPTEASKSLAASMPNKIPQVQSLLAKSTVLSPPAKESAFESLPSANESGIMYITQADFKFSPQDPSAVAQIQYQPQELLLGYVQRAYKEAKQRGRDVRLEGPWRPITIYHQLNEIGVEKNLRHLYAMALLRIPVDKVSMRALKRGNHPNESSDELRMPMEQFLWKLALRTSLGRVPYGTNLYAPVKLRRWPNLSRNAVTPHAFQIAALWTKQATSLLQTADILSIPLRYVFVFYAAAGAAGLISKQSAIGQGRYDSLPGVAEHSQRNIFKLIVNRFRDI